MRRIAGAAAALALATGAVCAQDFPSKPITLVVPFPAGAVFDISSRLIGDAVGRSVGQRVVIDNKAGAGGIVAAGAVKEAKPDGYSLYMANIGTQAILEALQKLPFDPVKDFEPITQTNSFSVFVAVPAASPHKSAADVIAAAKKGGVRYGSQGVGSGTHILGAMWADATKSNLEHVPYRGSSPMLVDLIAARIDIGFVTWAAAKEYVRDGKLRLLAIASTKRWPHQPDVPTMAEAGYPGIDQDVWFGPAAPAGTPKPVVDKLYAEFVKASKDPELVKRLDAEGVNIVTSASPEAFRALWVSETARWGKVIRDLGIKAE
jgi:tripartite-type tricarboxylate transporter receptor subunit TctC